jgi:phage-related protein
MANLTFKYTDKELENREASQIEFIVPEDMDINEYKVVCMRLAAAMGYCNDSIVKTFGTDDIDKIGDGLKNLLDEIGNTKNN